MRFNNNQGADAMTDLALLQEVTDRQAITDVIYRYCRAVDRIDPELGYSIWNEDAVADYGAIYQGDGRGVIDLICSQHQHLLCHSHQVSNILIELDGDTAGSEAYVTANLRLQAGEQLKQISIWARYIDQWSRRNGRWGIDKRTVIVDFDEIRDASYIALRRTL
jgi:SnoaL-like domain